MADERRTASKKPIPEPTPETRAFWEGVRAGELRLQRCERGCAPYFPPRPFCPHCGSRKVETFRASGRGRLHSYVINYRPARGFEDDGPYAIAVVELEEGPRLMTGITGVTQAAEELPLDLEVELAPEPISATISLPKFRPVAVSR